MRGGRRRPSFETRTCEHAVDKRHRIDHRNAVGLDFSGDRAQHRVIAEAANFCEHREGARVRREGLPEACAADSARHRGLGHAGSLEDVNHALQFADLYPGDLVDEIGQPRVGFVQVSECYYAQAMMPRCARDFEGKDSVARD